MRQENATSKVSIIVPIYNLSEYLDNCICSIINQDYRNIEILLVDDGSTDQSLKICQNYSIRDDRIKVLHKENGGVSSARNLGLDNATGHYITFVDGDDTIIVNAISTMVEEIQFNNADMCAFPCVIRNNNIIHAWDISQGIYNKYESIDCLMNKRFPTSLCTCLYKQELLISDRLREDIHHLEDFEYQFRILNKVERVYICEKAIYNYVQRYGSANNCGVTEKLLSCLLVSDTVEEAVLNDTKLKNEYINQTKFRLAMTVCAKCLMCNNHDNNLEKLFIETARRSLPDVMKGKDFKSKVQCFAITINYKVYAIIYKYIHKVKG